MPIVTTRPPRYKTRSGFRNAPYKTTRGQTRDMQLRADGTTTTISGRLTSFKGSAKLILNVPLATAVRGANAISKVHPRSR